MGQGKGRVELMSSLDQQSELTIDGAHGKGKGLMGRYHQCVC